MLDFVIDQMYIAILLFRVSLQKMIYINDTVLAKTQTNCNIAKEQKAAKRNNGMKPIILTYPLATFSLVSLLK